MSNEEYKQQLSGERANSVRHYLVLQVVSGEAVTAFGFGNARPATDDTAAGRQQNRHVGLILPTEVIGLR